MKEKNSFKFRAWDNKRKLMIDEVVVIDLYHEYIGYLYPSEIVQGEIVSRLPINDVIIMQSTGLKDKNGVEIYEGDIVIAWSQGVKGTFEIKRRADGLWLLYPAWKDGEFWYLRPTEDGRESCEVIGNIYKNSELLGVENE